MAGINFYNFYSLLLGILIILNILLLVEIIRMRRKLKIFFSGHNGRDLEGVLAEEIKRLKKCEKDIKELKYLSKILHKMAILSIQKVGVIRYNPFPDIGGNQSFSIALLDKNDNGLVITSLYTPEGTRVYCKPIIKSQSKYNLSQEEKAAIKKAKSNRIENYASKNL
ncbi:DUF4446 family protein [bacterium]|nr:DUF4446 family protein [bacterium]